MTLVITWTYILLISPLSIYLAINNMRDSKTSLVSALVYDCIVFAMYSNYALNFYLYILIAGKIRQDLKQSVQSVLERFRTFHGRECEQPIWFIKYMSKRQSRADEGKD